ncbi:hypothetical protein RB653_005629 [Dictyostelium firmibasis]|uniref:JmjC domain-containing protein n=1 Tax=Dictyostelium firmibasis TaxID=79012 RepID=A0AAN7U7Z5_9MYCE
MSEYNEDVELYIPHPYGVKPKGNFYFDSFNKDFFDSRKLGLGLFSVFEDNFIIDSILDLLSAEELTKTINLVSKAFYIYVQEEEQWKMKAINKFSDGEFKYHHSWQYTYKSNCDKSFSTEPTPIQVKYFYSDYLFHIHRCATVDLEQFEHGDSIDRRTNLTLEEFTRDYLIPNKPVIISDACKNWAAKNWTRETLAERCGDVKLYINAGVFMNVKDFFYYSEQCKEEMPMYLFDHYYGEKIPSLLDDYSADAYFKEDLFNVLGDKRPSFRWLLAGPSRSGASFHKDPNHTSAWNAVITGRKKWVMYPPHVVPPGVYPSDDGLEITAPSSIIEWFINFYEKPDSIEKDSLEEQQKENDKKNTRFKLKDKKVNIKHQQQQQQQKQQQQQSNDDDETGEVETYETVKPLEGILNAGEMIFVPSGWYHSVLNLEESIAITHNFIDSNNLLKVVDFMATKKKKDLYNEFTNKIEQAYPGKLESLKKAEKEKQEEIKRIEEEKLKNKKKSIWETATNDSNNVPTSKSFSFSFGDLSDNDD